MIKALTAGVLALCIPVAAMATEPLGRLFFTPAQRSTLDAGKHTAAKAPVKPGPRNVRLNGVVTRSDAERTIWINGTAYHNAGPDGVQIDTNPATPGSTSIRKRGGNVGTRVKVGQQLDLNSGRIDEDYSRRRTPVETTVAPQDETASRGAIARKPRFAEEDDMPTASRGKKNEEVRDAPLSK